MIAKKNCIPCQGGIPPLKTRAIDNLLTQLETGWEILEKKKLKKKYIFSKYDDAIRFSNLVAKLAEEESHHPFIHINYKEVIIILFTHKIDGLHENDFIIGAKCDQIYISNKFS